MLAHAGQVARPVVLRVLESPPRPAARFRLGFGAQSRAGAGQTGAAREARGAPEMVLKPRAFLRRPRLRAAFPACLGTCCVQTSGVTASVSCAQGVKT